MFSLPLLVEGYMEAHDDRPANNVAIAANGGVKLSE